MPLRRPTSYLVFAIINFVLGGMGLVCSPFALFEQSIGDPKLPREYYAFLHREVPYYQEYKYGSVAAGVLVGLGLVISGVGLLKPANWGRHLAIVCSLLEIAQQVFGIYYVAVHLMHANEKFFRLHAVKGMPANSGAIMSFAMYASVAVAGLFVIFYAIQIFILAKAGAPEPLPEEEDEYDLDEGPPRRSPDDDYDDQPRRHMDRDED